MTTNRGIKGGRTSSDKEHSLAVDQAEIDALVTALNVRMCFIETGTASVRAADAIEQDNAKIVRRLETSQRDLVTRCEKLVIKLLTLR